jgi:hypothetical protein
MVFERFAHSIAICTISGVTRLAGHTFVLFGEAPKKAGEAPALPDQKKTESKADKRPDLSCAWYFALCRLASRSA